MLIFYIRHGDPIYNPDSLTQLGHRQAEALSKRLALYGIDRIFSSTSNRAIETAIPISELVKKEIELLDFCNEDHAWHEFTVENGNGGLCWAFQDKNICRLFVGDEIKRLGEKWYEHPAISDYNFKSGVDRVNSEVDKWMQTLGYEHNRKDGLYRAVAPTNERIALFAHQGFGFAFLSSLLNIPYPQVATHFDMGHTGMTVIEFTATDDIVIPKVLTLSDDSHIYREGLPTYYNNGICF